MGTYYVKSTETDFVLKTVVDGQKEPGQSASQIIEMGVIEPNTISFGREKRLSCSRLHQRYLETYRPNGIIFTTKDLPEYVLPGDLIVLAESDEIHDHYYKIKDNLEFHYNHNLINGFERFMFPTFEQMIDTLHNPSDAFRIINTFRAEHGWIALNEEQRRLLTYNECVFTKPVHVKVVGLYGTSEEAYRLAQKHNLPLYKTAEEFFTTGQKH